MKRWTMAVLAVVVVAVVAVAAVLLWSGGREYGVSYELNGGTPDGENPSTYSPGDVLELTSPYSDEYYFDGWYLDEDLTKRFDGDTSGLSGDITLYAAWTDDLSGRSLTFCISGQVNEGPMNSYTVGGTVTYSYVYLDRDSGSYLMSSSYEYLYRFMLSSYSTSGSSTYWSGDSDVTWTQEDDETIDTVDGRRTCEVWVATYSDGSTERQWIADGWVVYRIESVSYGMFSESTVVYTLMGTSTFEVSDTVEVTVYADNGVTVSGDGTYAPGDSVTLTASVSSGTGFQGWYDSSGNLLSEDLEYTIDQVLADTVVYAANAAFPDYTLEDGEEMMLLQSVDVESATVTVYDYEAREVIATMDETYGAYGFPEAGQYVIVIEGTDADGDAVHLYYTVLVDGTVLRSYEWVSDGETYTYTLEIRYSDVAYYRDYYDVSLRVQDTTGNHERDRSFVTYTDQYIVKMAEDFAEMTSGWTELERANFVLAFAQYIEYQSDEVYMGYGEYWKFPLETLYDQGGDCEDTSILLAALYEAMGYDAALLIYSGHMATGVYIGDAAPGMTYEIGTTGWGPSQQVYIFYYCETTATGYEVGDKPMSVGTCQTMVVI